MEDYIWKPRVYEDERKCIEAMEIQKHTGDLMNGCTGRTITI